MMSFKIKPEVLVVGAGPVGLLSALALARKGIRVTIIDKDWRTGAHSYALALHPRSIELLGEYGLADAILERAHVVGTIGLYDSGTRRAEMRIPDQEEGASPLAVMRQDVLEFVLEEALKREGVKILWNHSISGLDTRGDAMVATIDKLVKESVGYAVARTEWLVAKSFDVEVPFVIGADGHHSYVRRSLGIDFRDLGGTQHFAVFEIDTNTDSGHEMRIVMGEATSDVFWPLPGQKCRWSFQLLDHDVPESARTKSRLPIEIGSARFPSLDAENLRTMLAERAPWFTSTVKKITWRIMVRFERRLAEAFGRDRAWLAGDSGHITGPVGMQSMNVGLREAKQLTDIMAGILRDGASTDLLQDYNCQRIAEWRGLLGLDGALVPQQQIDPWVRERGARILPCIPASGAELAALAQQLRLTMP